MPETVFKEGHLEEWFLKRKKSDFPYNIDYVLRYKYIKEGLRNNVQKYINLGNLETLRSSKKSSEVPSMTGHGPEHFDTVIDVASELTSKRKIELTAYEVFILLASIQVHDIGNILGRINHEKNARDVFYESIPDQEFLDSVENEIFFTVAQAHSGEIDGDKDTIGRIERYTRHNGKKLRTKLIASLIRLADELADAPNRAFSYLKKIGLILKGSEIYHVYANSLRSTNIELDTDEINLSYKFDITDVNTKYGKGDTKIYLLDEIFDRNIKLYLEVLYCSKFLQPYIIIDQINIDITIFSLKFKDKIETIRFRLINKGYPQFPLNGIKDICENPESQLKKDKKFWSGSLLKRVINS